MMRVFNTTGPCNPEIHYMVNIDKKLEQIKRLIDAGAYFNMNKARQYGKTTTIKALKNYLSREYVVLPLDFQKIGNEEFTTAELFCRAFIRHLLATINSKKAPIAGLDKKALDDMYKAENNAEMLSLNKLFTYLQMLCETAEKPVVLIIDEVDSASNNQVFLDFLAQLRGDYLNRDEVYTFQSVILAGVHDVKNIRYKIRPEEAHKVNSPWNIAADFNIDMSFSADGIAGMLQEYENDHHTGMDTEKIAGLIYEYTSGYPFLVSRICQLIDSGIAGTAPHPDKKAAWTEAEFVDAVKQLINEPNSLFQSLIGKLINIPEMNELVAKILFSGVSIPYVAVNQEISLAGMYGFIKSQDNVIAISNRIFESVLYNYLLSQDALDSEMYHAALEEKPQYVENGCLNMKHVLARFVEIFDEIYGDKDESFREDVGRKYFMLFMKPIINGVGFSYVEARTRDLKRTDMIVQYGSEQFIIEMKIWKGPKYHAEGEKQLAEYLDIYHQNTGYLLTFNFNKHKMRGIKEEVVNGKTLIEATV